MSRRSTAALTTFERGALGVNDTETFLTGNVGGGVKWYSGNSRWGLRGDYRLTIVTDTSNGPTYFGGNGDERYGHRLSGGVILNHRPRLRDVVLTTVMRHDVRGR